MTQVTINSPRLERRRAVARWKRQQTVLFVAAGALTVALTGVYAALWQSWLAQ